MRATTRKGRFLEYQKRFRKRAGRQRGSVPYHSTYYRVGVTGMNRPRGPWTFANRGVMQLSMHSYIRHPTAGTFLPPYVFEWLVLPGVGYKSPPHTHIIPEHGTGNHHLEGAFINFHNRPVQRLGHKLNRNDGFNRQCWWALNWFLAAKRIQGTAGDWPAWDPLHRTPVISDIPPWER